MKRFFIAGTDTDIGKTLVSRLLIRQLVAAGYKTAALKPVAAGAKNINGCTVNEDALLLQEAANVDSSYSQVNPFLFREPIAPHVAAESENRPLNVNRCVEACQPVLESGAEICIIEGAGGWLVPLNESETMADLAVQLQAEIVLVVGLRLGCISHALLTAQAIRASGAKLAGWVANALAPEMLVQRENIEAIAARIDAPLLAEVPYFSDVEQSECVDQVCKFALDCLVSD